MRSSRKENLEAAPFPDLSLRKSSIRSLDGFRSPSPLPSSQGLLSGKQNVLYELAKSIQTDGTKVKWKSYCSVVTNYIYIYIAIAS